MKRVAVFLGLLALAVAPAVASAQGFLDGSFLGPYFGTGGGTSSCDDVKPAPPCVFYVGYSGDPGSSTGFDASAQGQGIGTVVDIKQSYAARGVWLGVSKAMALSNSVGVVGSIWYLIPDKSVQSRETYFAGFGNAERTWSTNTQWWYADLLAAFGSLNGFSLLAGFRYDFFTTRFRNPFNDVLVGGQGTDTADVKSNGYIPLVGGQMAYAGSYGSLLFRLVGVPTLVGRVTYDQTIAGLVRVESSGSYKGQYFLEAFTEYAYAVNGRADLGFFARFNSTRGTVNLNIDDVVQGVGVLANDTFSLAVSRNEWTLGGRMNLRF